MDLKNLKTKTEANLLAALLVNHRQEISILIIQAK